jgi:hypothetical protein
MQHSEIGEIVAQADNVIRSVGCADCMTTRLERVTVVMDMRAVVLICRDCGIVWLCWMDYISGLYQVQRPYGLPLKRLMHSPAGETIEALQRQIRLRSDYHYTRCSAKKPPECRKP